jgi:hypothetical protein
MMYLLFFSLLVGSVAAKDILELPWSDLADQGVDLKDGTRTEYMAQCLPIFVTPNSTQYDLLEQEHGLCVNHYYCGYHRCSASPDFAKGQMTHSDYEQYLEETLLALEPVYNLPPKVAFPRNAGDVVAAMNFAKTHGVELSVKNSGHSYSGSSTKADTLLVNMFQYKQYSFNTTTNGIIKCDDVVETDVDGDVDLDTELCRLVQARGKRAAVRVGGGENFDKLYRSIKEANEALEKYEYHVVGGASGGVSPMGWTWQGGLSGTTRGREFGFGVDQVLQIEAVLPSGEHARFGPTSWEDSEGYLYPKTTEVSGVCNRNPDDEEDDWVWGACSEETDVLFDDLWFAFRGGGGGSWGIVLSVYLQLHDHKPFHLIYPTPECSVERNLLFLLGRFSVDYFLDPQALNITETESNLCGSPSSNYRLFYCYYDNNDVSEGNDVISKWREFFSKNSDGYDFTLTETQVAIGRECLKQFDANDLLDTILAFPENHARAGQVTEDPPSWAGYGFSTNLLLPKSWVLENKDFMADYDAIKVSYYAFAGATNKAHDQTTSLSIAHRDAGVMIFVPDSMFDEGRSDAEFEFEYEFPRLLRQSDAVEMYDFTTGVVPPYIGSNHLTYTLYGPSKDDPTMACPKGDLTTLEADSLCHSAHEAVWGTKNLELLVSIKQAVDPNGIFDCNNCVPNEMPGNDVPSTKSPKSPKKGTKAPKKAKK